MHPFYDAVDDVWKPVAWLGVGSVVKTKEGIACIKAKVQLAGTHTVYNFTVGDTHNYLVGGGGYLVHNDCGDLNKLSDKFKGSFSPALKRAEIANWWAKKGPTKGGDINDSFFGRGRFFETLLRTTKFSKWEWTYDLKSNFKAIDFYKKVGAKNIVGSLKTTKSSPGEWLNYNQKHLKDLGIVSNNKGITDGSYIAADEVWLYIAVPKNKLNEWANFATTLQGSGIQGVGKIKVEVFSMEKELGI